jgi:hypothetical protein
MNVLMRAVRAILMLPMLGAALAVDPSALSSAHAATITAPGLHIGAARADAKKTDANWPSDPVLCDLVLDGNIAEGDAKALEQAFQSIVGVESSFTFFLCLRSDGGDLREAVQIAQLVLRTQRPSIASVVEDGRTCASACAVIFLAGNAPARVGAWPQRFLHPRGKLLFHSSQLDVGSRSDKDLLDYLTKPDPGGLKGRIGNLYADGLRDAQSVIATYQKLITQREDVGDRWVRPSLFLEMFAQAPNEWLCIDTVDAVGRWNIQVYGYQPPKPPKKEHYSNLCHSAYHWRTDEFAVGADYELEEEGELKRPPATTPVAGRTKGNAEFDDRYAIPYQARLSPLTCVVELTYGWDPATEARKKQLDASTTLTTLFAVREPSTPGSVAVSALAPTAYYPAATLLRDLPGVRAPPDWAAPKTRPPVGFADHPDRVMNGCSYRSMPKIDRAACAAACATDAACRGYSHNKVSQTCELKHTLTALRLDPLWTSGAPSPGPDPGRSIRANVMAAYPANGDLAKGFRLVGKLIDDAKAERQECSTRCKSDQACVALEYGEASGACRRFSEVTGSRVAVTGSRSPSAEEEVFTTEIKKQ